MIAIVVGSSLVGCSPGRDLSERNVTSGVQRTLHRGQAASMLHPEGGNWYIITDERGDGHKHEHSMQYHHCDEHDAAAICLSVLFPDIHPRLQHSCSGRVALSAVCVGAFYHYYYHYY